MDSSSALKMGENDPSAPARYMAQPSTMRSQDIRRQDLAAIQTDEVSSIDAPATLPPQHTKASGLVGPCLQQATSPSVETHQPNDSGAGSAVLEQRPLIGGLPASEPWEQPSTNTLPSPTANARASRLFRERRKERERVLRQTVAELADRNAALEASLFHHGIVPPNLRQDLSIHRSQRRGGPPMHIPGVTTSLPTGLQSLPTTQQSGRASSASGSGSRDHDFSSGSSRDSSDCFRRTAPDLRTAQQTPCEPMLQASGMVMPRPTAQMFPDGLVHSHGMYYRNAGIGQHQQRANNPATRDSSDLANLADRLPAPGTTSTASDATAAGAATTAATEAASAVAPATQRWRRQVPGDAFDAPTRRPMGRAQLRARSPSDSTLSDRRVPSTSPERMPTGTAGLFPYQLSSGYGRQGMAVSAPGAGAAIPSAGSNHLTVPETWLPHTSAEVAGHSSRALPSESARAISQSLTQLAEPIAVQNGLGSPAAPSTERQSVSLPGRLPVSTVGNSNWPSASAVHGSASAFSSGFGSPGGVPYPWLRQQGSFAQALALMPLSDSSQGSGSSASQASTRESHMSAGDSVPEEAAPDRRWTSVPMISDDAPTPPARLGQPGSTLSSPSRWTGLAEDPASSELVSTLDLSTSSHSKLASADLNWAKMAKVLKPELKRFLVGASPSISRAAARCTLPAQMLLDHVPFEAELGVPDSSKTSCQQCRLDEDKQGRSSPTA
ncbi:hypothetical protein PANT_26c00034 [Moesziomyces antarcticus T-34]|uniref:BZIP domain-containing protein n=1 Tax=Pseudozyma antarctica (strain T-34) TaxID=1151754 RepID=M9M195_PSEA3|nr:hypothetical protein PANT_26c00034 [Moesziomyces antarcticus T-34]